MEEHSPGVRMPTWTMPMPLGPSYYVAESPPARGLYKLLVSPPLHAEEADVLGRK